MSIVAIAIGVVLKDLNVLVSHKDFVSNGAISTTGGASSGLTLFRF